MKAETLYMAIGDMDESYIAQAHLRKYRRVRPVRIAVAACLAAAVLGAMLLTRSFHREDPVEGTAATEYAFSQRYHYGIAEGPFSDYFPGMVIDAAKIGSKLGETTVMAGWQNAEFQWMTTETLRAEVYEIQGIATETAVALKFLDQGEALTLTHYYVQLNPEADLSAVSEYVIRDWMPDNAGEE